MVRLATLALLIVTVVGCGGIGAPTATPGGMDDVIANLVLRDVTVLRLVSGDPGCVSSALHDNAVHLTVAIGAQSVAHEIYLLRWRDQADFEAAATDFEACVADYRALNPGFTVSTLERAPWRAYGPTWTDMLRSILEDALLAAGGS